MKLTLPILLILLCAMPALAADPWSKADVQREVACVVLNLMDYATTDRILGESNRAMEANPLLGPHPSRETLIAVTAGTTALHALVTHYMPGKYRAYWQWPWIGIKLLAVGNNLHVGIALQF